MNHLIVGSHGQQVVSTNQPDRVTANVFEDDIATVDPKWNRKPYGGQAKTFGNGSWLAAGKRLFYRTSGYLWCIGDPKQL